MDLKQISYNSYDFLTRVITELMLVSRVAFEFATNVSCIIGWSRKIGSRELLSGSKL
jgi:hypothetical protein